MFCTDELSISIFTTLSHGFFSEHVPVLVYYSHLTAVIVSLALGAFVYSSSKTLPSKILFSIAVIFSSLAILDIFLWTQIDVSVLMLLWSFWLFLFSLLFTLSFYFLYTLLRNRDVSFRVKLMACSALIVILLFSFSKHNLTSFDVSNCAAIEGPWMINVIFGLSLLVLISTIAFGVREVRRVNDILVKSQAVPATIGVSCFLLMFAGASYFASISNILGAEPDTFKWEQYGYFGMTIFMGFLTYLIIEFKTFNVKLLSAQALVLSLVGLIASEFFFVRSYTNIVLVGVTLVLAIVFGFFLVRSVKREVQLREQLQVANEGQANLLHIINHQIKGYMTKARLVFDDLLNDESYALTPQAKPMIKQGYESVTEGVEFVQDFLNASNIEQGTFTYNMVPLDFQKIVEEQGEKQRDQAQAKGLEYKVEVVPGNYNTTGDLVQLDQAVRNLIDNSIKYTPNGSVSVRLTNADGKALLTIVDTGVGLSDEVKPKLFTKGGRDKNSQKININSTGFGLAFVKGVALAHKGRVWAESPGVGKGSTFYFEIPIT